MDEFTDLERAVEEMILGGDDPRLPALRRQWDSATLVSREYTGVGFYTTLRVPKELALEGHPHLTAADVHADIEGLEHGAGFVLFVIDGLMETLEGYTSADRWPGEVRGFKLTDFDETPTTTSGRRRGGLAGLLRRFLGRSR
jgi:hypothetical protein